VVALDRTRAAPADRAARAVTHRCGRGPPSVAERFPSSPDVSLALGVAMQLAHRPCL
jgi:hypothetical protein